MTQGRGSAATFVLAHANSNNSLDLCFDLKKPDGKRLLCVIEIRSIAPDGKIKAEYFNFV